MKDLREALNSMNESMKNPTNGEQEDTAGASEHIGGGGLHGVHIAVHPDGTHSVHAHHLDGTSTSTKHASHEEAIVKAHEHLKAHHAAHHGGK